MTGSLLLYICLCYVFGTFSLVTFHEVPWQQHCTVGREDVGCNCAVQGLSPAVCANDISLLQESSAARYSVDSLHRVHNVPFDLLHAWLHHAFGCERPMAR